ncbi:MAG TPA: hypothetical protein VGW78_03715 [Candidatus Babeliales bacterium]|jgi:uncharacterized alkaline shock family protein YloU|nr:hypothetical protein [Candidatus Babeliales bacterium]
MKLNIYLKYITIVYGISIVSGISADHVRLINTTDSETSADIKIIGYKREQRCSNKQIVIAPNSEHVVEIGECCAYSVQVRGTSGSIKDQVKEIVPKMHGIPCNSYAINIKNIDGALVIEQSRWVEH